MSDTPIGILFLCTGNFAHWGVPHSAAVVGREKS